LIWKRFQSSLPKSELETDVKALGKKVEKAVAQFKKETGKDFELWFEPGNIWFLNLDIFW
jgi:diaminopimelate decarboxylase